MARIISVIVKGRGGEGTTTRFCFWRGECCKSVFFEVPSDGSCSVFRGSGGPRDGTYVAIIREDLGEWLVGDRIDPHLG